MRGLHQRMTALLIFSAFLPLAVISVGAWIVFEGIIAEKSKTHLQTVVADHAQTVELFLDERMMALQFAADTHDKDQLGRPGSLEGTFQRLNASYRQSFLDLGVIDEDGSHLAYVGPYDLLSHNYRDADWFARVVKDGTYISDVFLGYRNEPHFILAVRRDEPDGSFWVLRASVNPTIFESLVSRGRLGKTGDCFLLDRQGRYQTPPLSGAAVLSDSGMKLPATAEPVSTYTARGPDGGRLIRTVRWIKHGDWLLVAQQAQREVNAPIRAAMARGIGVFVVGVLFITITAVLATRYLVRLIERLTDERQALNAQLLRAGKLASLGEMATGIAHEINNPLGIIFSEQTNISDLLGELPAGDERIGEMLGNVAMTKKQVNRCKVITQKMLQFGRQSLSLAQDIDAGQQVREIVSLLAQHARVNDVAVCLEIEPDLPPIEFDPGEFQQVVTNLFNNAVQAMNDAGALRISVWGERGSVFIEIEDTGPGIPRDEVARIFEPFFTTKPVGKGTGLGLSVCFGIVTQWRGEITVASPMGGRRLLPGPHSGRGQRGGGRRQVTQGDSHGKYIPRDFGPARRRQR